MTQVPFADAVKKVTSELNKDENLRHSYKANIAMAFKDEFHRTKDKGVGYINNDVLHEIANNAADNFLTNWCADTKN